jgi:hypothetical protein
VVWILAGSIQHVYPLKFYKSPKYIVGGYCTNPLKGAQGLE